MPFYDYNCTNCRYVFEINKGMTAVLDVRCPKCGLPAQRIFSVPRTLRSSKDALDSIGSEQSGSCSTCSSGVCSSCGGG